MSCAFLSAARRLLRVVVCTSSAAGCMLSAARSRLRVVCCALSAACVHVTSRVSCGLFVTAHACATWCGLYVAWSAFLVASSSGAHRLATLLLRVPSAYLECPKEHPEYQRCANALAPAHICAGTGWARPCPHLHRDSAHDCHICIGTLGHSSSSARHRRLQHGCTASLAQTTSTTGGLTSATSAPGLGSPRQHLHTPAHISTGTRLNRPHQHRDWMGSPRPHLRRDWMGSPRPHLRV